MDFMAVEIPLTVVYMQEDDTTLCDSAKFRHNCCFSWEFTDKSKLGGTTNYKSSYVGADTGRSQRKSSRVSDSDDDIFSTSSIGESSDLTVNQEVDEDLDKSAMLESHLDALYEKRSSTRESGLNAIMKAFTSSVQLEFAVRRNETLVHQYVSLIKHGSPSKAALAAHALGLLAVTLGASKITHQIIEESSPHLGRVAKLSSDVACRISALQSLAVVTFIGEADVERIEKTVDMLWQVGVHKGGSYADQASGITNPPPEAREAALYSWSFLLTKIPRQKVDSFLVKQTLPVLLSFLNTDVRAVCIAVGEAIAIIFETTGWINMDEIGFSVNSIRSESKKDNIARSSLSMEALTRRVIEQMRVLMAEAGGKGSSKKELNSQRSSFRELLAYIEDGIRPTTSVKLQNGDVLEIKTWSQRIQLNMFRRFLGGGFQKHMQ
ncbi:hypothetical protein KI387_018069, partial [Taxus chinensis]